MPDLPSITRRIFLKSTPVAVAAAGAVSVSVAAPAAAVTPLERFQAAVAELKASAEALDPNIYDWTVRTNGHQTCGMVIAAFRRTTSYEGDGWYDELHETGADRPVYVRRAPEHDRDGERWFRVSRDPKQRGPLMAEKHFSTSYGKKISA